MCNEIIQVFRSVHAHFTNLQLINSIKNLTNSYDKCGVSPRLWHSVECPFPHPLWLNDRPDLGNVLWKFVLIRLFRVFILLHVTEAVLLFCF